jgi:hypothetical protein
MVSGTPLEVAIATNNASLVEVFLRTKLDVELQDHLKAIGWTTNTYPLAVALNLHHILPSLLDLKEPIATPFGPFPTTSQLAGHLPSFDNNRDPGNTNDPTDWQRHVLHDSRDEYRSGQQRKSSPSNQPQVGQPGDSDDSNIRHKRTAGFTSEDTDYRANASRTKRRPTDVNKHVASVAVGYPSAPASGHRPSQVLIDSA